MTPTKVKNTIHKEKQKVKEKYISKRTIGRFSKEALSDMLNDNISDMDIALRYNKELASVTEKRRKLLLSTAHTTQEEESLIHLHNIYFWSSVKKLLFEGEIKFFEQEWLKLHSQFASQGVLPTDEIMMKDLILHEVMANRAAEQKKKNILEIESLQKKINNEFKKDDLNRNPEIIAGCELQKSNLQSAIANYTKEHLEYQKKKDEKLEQLKATRSQRLKQAEMAGKNIWDMLKELDRPEMRRKYGKYTQKMKLAADIIKDQWQLSVEYEDGQWDQPLLSPDKTINNVEKDKNEKLSTDLQEEKEEINK